MLPEDINDIIIAFILLVLLGSAACVLQSPVGKVFGTEGVVKQAKIITEEYNFEESIFLLNYLRSPIEKDNVDLVIADYVFMCGDKLKELKKETKNIFRGYDKEISLVILCDGKREILCGGDIEDGTSLVLKEDYGIEVRLYGKSKFYSAVGPPPSGGCG